MLDRKRETPLGWSRIEVVDVEQGERGVRNLCVDLAVSAHLRVVTHTAQQPQGDTRSTTGAPRNFRRADWLNRHLKQLRRTLNNLLDRRRFVEVKAFDHAKAGANRARPRRAERHVMREWGKA